MRLGLVGLVVAVAAALAPAAQPAPAPNVLLTLVGSRPASSVCGGDMPCDVPMTRVAIAFARGGPGSATMLAVAPGTVRTHLRPGVYRVRVRAGVAQGKAVTSSLRVPAAGVARLRLVLPWLGA